MWPNLNWLVMPYVITMMNGLIFPSAMRLSMIRLAWPWLLHAVSSSPQPCCRYKTGYFLFVSLLYPGGVYTNARREVLVLLEGNRICATSPWGTSFNA